MSDENYPPGFVDEIDINVFAQIREMDEGDEENQFSRGVVVECLRLTELGFLQIDAVIKKKDLEQLSRVGEQLKNALSSVSIWRVKDTMEKIQVFAAGYDESGREKVSCGEAEILRRINDMIPKAKDDFNKAKRALIAYYQLDENEFRIPNFED